MPEDFTFGDQCDLFDPEDTSAVSIRRQNINTNEVRAHLDTGKTCNKISLIWQGELKVLIDKDIVLRGIKILSSDDAIDDDDDGDPIAQLNANFVNMMLEPVSYTHLTLPTILLV